MRLSVPKLLAAGLAAVLAALLAIFVIPAATASAAPTSGYNDWSCKPSPAHPEPVVLLHGLGANGDLNWTTHGPKLAAAGYCAFSVTYGQGFPGGPGGTIPIAQSAPQIGAFIDKVLASTGAAKVSIVGHSEGAFQSLYVPKVLNYASKVRRVVALAPPTHGTTFAGLVTVGQLLGGQAFVEALTNGVTCFACSDLIVGGGAVKKLTDGPIAQPGVEYTIIASRLDLIVTPTDTGFVKEPGVKNKYIQDSCLLDPVGHVGIAVDSTITSMITNALDPAHAGAVQCGLGLPL
jgi:triacylglycerol esterase/lipase EstA (alpha/beta hydrolase family)